MIHRVDERVQSGGGGDAGEIFLHNVGGGQDEGKEAFHEPGGSLMEPVVVMEEPPLGPLPDGSQHRNQKPSEPRLAIASPRVGADVVHDGEGGAEQVGLGLAGEDVLLEKNVHEAHVVDGAGDGEGGPGLLDELEELVDFVQDVGLVAEVEDGAEEGYVEVEVEGVTVGPVADVGRDVSAGGGDPPGEGDHGVAERPHGLRVLAGVDGAGLGAADDVSEAGGEGVGWGGRDGRVEEEAGFQDLELPFLPDLVLFGVAEFGWLKVSEEFQRQDYRFCSSPHLLHHVKGVHVHGGIKEVVLGQREFS